MSQPTFDQSIARTPEAIFIVGVSRSGTSLMRKILNASDKIAIAWENHFLGHLIASEGARYRFRKFGDLSDDNNVRKLVDYIYSGNFWKSSRYRDVSTQWRWIVRKVDKEDFLQRILDSDRSEHALFTVMMRVFADSKRKPIMGEKTPAHVRYVPTILDWFPKGRIIHMLRDPRGIFVSELRRRQKAVTVPYRQLKRFKSLFKLYIVLQTTIVWFESVQRYRRYKRLYPNNYYLLRFEDLVTDPIQQVEQLCEFLGIDFQDKMLDQFVVSDGFQAGQDGFDSQAAVRWRRHIDPWINAWFVFWFRKDLKEFGYADIGERSFA
jgi:Sulfotransferase family